MLEGVVDQLAIVDDGAHVDLGNSSLISAISLFILLNMFDQVFLQSGLMRDCDEGMNMQAVVWPDISQTIRAHSFSDGPIWDRDQLRQFL